MGFFAVVLLLLLIFILQNGATVQVSYLGAHGRLPLGVAMLLSTVCGVLLVVLAGAARISQLRTTARRHRRIDARRAAAVPAASPAPSVHLAPSTHPAYPEPPTASMPAVPAVPDAPAAGPDPGR
jgi:uncharacterized integral membrane protein